MKLRHDGLLKQALSRAPTARISQDTGDGYFVVFESIAQSVSCALIFQSLMLRESWEHPFKTRVGLHLGEVQEGRSSITGRADFTSSAIDVANRTMSLAMGGQILTTRAVFDAAEKLVSKHPIVAEGEAAPKLRWLSHAEYRFKGASDPIEVFEIGAEGVAPLRPPPNSDKARRHKRLLEARTTSSGRRQALTLLAAQLSPRSVLVYALTYAYSRASPPTKWNGPRWNIRWHA